MMLVTYVFILFPLFVTGSQHLFENRISKYEYLLFENFESTKNSFLKEQKTVKQLQNFRNSLYERLELLQDSKDRSLYLKNESSIYSINVPNFKHNINIRRDGVQNRNPEVLSVTEPFTNNQISREEYNDVFKYERDYKNTDHTDIMRAALRGLIMLQATYNQDMQEYSKGHLSYKNRLMQTSRKTDSLKPEDLVTLSTIALNDFNWIDNAITYLKAAIHKYYSISTESDNNQSDDFEQLLLAMKKHYSIYHNEMLAKKDNPIGPEWKLHPYIVDSGA